MASEEKIQHLFEVIKVRDMQVQNSKKILDAMKPTIMDKVGVSGNEVDKMLQIQMRIQEMVLDKIMPLAVKAYMEVFTDEQVDSLIEIFGSEAYQAFQAAVPSLMEKMSMDMMDVFASIDEEIEKIVDSFVELEAQNEDHAEIPV